MNIFKIMGLALLCTLLSSVVKGFKKEFSIYIIIASGLLFFSVISDYTLEIFTHIETLCQRVGIDFEFAEIILKVTGIAYISEFTSSVCRDSGETSLALKVDLAGKLIILLASLPVMESLITTVFSLKGV